MTDRHALETLKQRIDDVLDGHGLTHLHCVGVPIVSYANQRQVVTFPLPPKSLDPTNRDRLANAVWRHLPNPPFTLEKQSNVRFEGVNALGLSDTIDYKDTMTIVFRELAVSDENMRSSCRIVTSGFIAAMLLALVFMWLVGKDL